MAEATSSGVIPSSARVSELEEVGSGVDHASVSDLTLSLRSPPVDGDWRDSLSSRLGLKPPLPFAFPLGVTRDVPLCPFELEVGVDRGALFAVRLGVDVEVGVELREGADALFVGGALGVDELLLDTALAIVNLRANLYPE